MVIRLFERNITSSVIVMYSLYLYFVGLSLRNTFKALEIFKEQNKSPVAVWVDPTIWFTSEFQKKSIRDYVKESKFFYSKLNNNPFKIEYTTSIYHCRMFLFIPYLNKDVFEFFKITL